MSKGETDCVDGDGAETLGLADVLMVLGFWQLAVIGIFAVLEQTGASPAARVNLFRYGVFGLSYGLPLWWLKRRGIAWRSIGLWQGQRSLPEIFTVAMAAAALLSAGGYWVSGEPLPALSELPQLLRHLLVSSFLLLTVDGMALFVLTPIGEEILFRGFFYSGLRRQFGVVGACVLQAMLFSLAHFDAILAGNWLRAGLHFGQGIVFGVLFVFTGGLAASMLAHGIFNFLSFVVSMP